MRWPFVVVLSALSVFGLFWLMHWLVLPPEGGRGGETASVMIEVAPPPPDQTQEESASSQPVEAPPVPPNMPSIALTMDVAMPVNLSPSTATSLNIPSPDVELGGSAVGMAGFGGFAPGRAGRGAGRGQRINGSTLVPLSTARPQIPKEAYEAGIEGWVEVVFYVTKEGRVTNIRIVDAQPKGVFEAAMIESVRNWIYPVSSGAREVQQRFDFKLDDYQYNWN